MTASQLPAPSTTTSSPTPTTVGATPQHDTSQAPASPPRPKHPATLKQKVWLCIFLTVFSVFSLWRTFAVIKQVNDAALVESSVTWRMPAGAHLRIGPPAFHHDPDRNLLSYRGTLDAAQQLQLRDLLEFDPEPSAGAGVVQPAASSPSTALASSAAPASASGSRSASAIAAERAASAVQAARAAARALEAASAGAASAAKAPGPGTSMSASELKNAAGYYYAAIDLLAYKAQGTQARQVQLLLYLGALGGLLGALLRSFVDFVGNACYKDQLDLVVWWPLYVTRPMVGAMLGFLLVVLFKAKLLTNTDVQTAGESFWWLGMAAIGGFSTIDVTARLRQAAKALFGGNEAAK